MIELADHCRRFRPPSESRPLREWFDFFYAVLSERYRCEYVYKNAIATSLYLGRHSLQDSLLTDELRSGSSRADVVILNGTSTVYEIKSKYDSFERIDGQLADYRTLFDKIYLVTTGDRAYSALSHVGPSAGVMGLDDDGHLYVIRDASSNKGRTDPAAIFDCMRRSEFTAAIKMAFGRIPDVPNSQLYRESKKMFCELPPETAHDLMVAQVKMRGKKKPYADLINNAPISLKHACLSFSRSPSLAIQALKKLDEAFT